MKKIGWFYYTAYIKKGEKMPAKKKEVEVIDQGGAKTVKKKTSFVSWTKRIFAIFSIIWIALVIWAPLWVKNTYSEPIKKSIVVSMFFDLQRNIVEQYEMLLDGIKDSINLEEPVAFAIDNVRMAEDAVEKVTDTTAKAKDATAKAEETTDKVQETTDKVQKLSGLASKFGINTSGVDKALGDVNKGVEAANAGIDKANETIQKVDDTAALVNKKLDEIETDLTGVLQVQIDDMIDTAGTIVAGAQILKEKGAKDVYIACTHGVLSGPAVDRLKDCVAKEVIITDTIAIPEEKRFDKLVQISVAELLAYTIESIENDLPVSDVFQHFDFKGE